MLAGVPAGLPLSQAQSTVILVDNDEPDAGYWIGVECSPVDDALRAQLKLDKGEGLVVLNVAPDSPAAKAGLKPFDVLTKVGDEPLGELSELVGAVAKAHDTELKLEVVRAGKTEAITIKPAKRPGMMRPSMTVIPERDREALDQWLKQMRPGEAPGRPMAMQFFHPGVVFPSDAKLPEGTTVTIVGQGDKPAKITVKQGDKTWEVAEDKLNELPENVRGFVARLMPPGSRAWSAAFSNGRLNMGTAPGADAAGRIFGPGGNFERQMQQLQERMEKLQSKLEKLEKQGLGDDKPAAKDSRQ
jgi:membrane-associated protease RseP (regulator of RpoE activity)